MLYVRSKVIPRQIDRLYIIPKQKVGVVSTPTVVEVLNLGGNFLPQGSACDMATLELAKKNRVEDMNYKKLLKVGGLFALVHIILGILYLAFLVFVLP